jgi:hypothetical protein
MPYPEPMHTPVTPYHSNEPLPWAKVCLARNTQSPSVGEVTQGACSMPGAPLRGPAAHPGRGRSP